MSVPENGDIWNNYITLPYYMKTFPKHTLVHIISQKNVTYEQFNFIVSPRSAALAPAWKSCTTKKFPWDLQ